MTSQPAFDRRDWTYDDYLQLDDDTRYEIFEGVLTLVPAPNLGHQRVSGELYSAFRRHVKENASGEVFFAPVDVILDERNVVQPDIIFVSSERGEILQFRGIMGAPDLVVEIISPGSGSRDREVKKRLYERFGVREYWMVDPEKKRVDVLVLGKEGYRIASSAAGKGDVRSEVLDGVTVPIEMAFP